VLEELVMTPNEAIAVTKLLAHSRRRCEGSLPYRDEILVIEIERLRAVLAVLGYADVVYGAALPDGLAERGA
jgi:hypothetical protein